MSRQGPVISDISEGEVVAVALAAIAAFLDTEAAAQTLSSQTLGDRSWSRVAKLEACGIPAQPLALAREWGR